MKKISAIRFLTAVLLTAVLISSCDDEKLSCDVYTKNITIDVQCDKATFNIHLNTYGLCSLNSISGIGVEIFPYDEVFSKEQIDSIIYKKDPYNYSEKVKAKLDEFDPMTLFYSNDIDTIFTVTATSLKHNTLYVISVFVEVGSEIFHGPYDKIMTLPDKYEAGKPVDLGLSVKWASKNVEPDSYGKNNSDGIYFYHGHIYPYYNWHRYNDNFYNYSGPKYDNDNLSPEYDVARHYWGDGWRTPTKDEWRELIEKCEWSFTSEQMGAKVTGPNGNSIILPIMGLCNNLDDNYVGTGEAAAYMSATNSGGVNAPWGFWLANNYSKYTNPHPMQWEKYLLEIHGSYEGIAYAVRPVKD
ncbi:MAG: hypothetical protein HUJ96_03300 [Marinilabiliaceae bacterium]|nr:hypothetical protein [Marinilabiliaceae bacterium]